MTPPSGHITEALLERYLDGECTPAEAERIDAWLHQSAANRAVLDDARSRLNSRSQKPKWDVEAMWQNVGRTMHVASDARVGRIPQVHSTVPLRNPRYDQRYWYAAMAVAAALTIVVGVYRRSTPETGALPKPREYSTQRGQQATIQLTDGTRLVLAAASKVRIPSEFGIRSREIFLDGEAVLDVVHDSARSFRVRSKGAVIEDIGTRFDVRAYGDDSIVTVAVAEGAVALAPRSDLAVRSRTLNGLPQKVEGVLLHAGDVGTLARDGRVSTTRDAFVSRRFAWTSGRLEVVDTRLDEVLRTVGRWYDVDIRASSELSARVVTASLSVRSIEQMANALALAVDARVERKGNTIMLRRK